MDAMKLLIADGNEEFRRALAAELQGAYHVRCCGDGKEALSLLRSFVPDVLVLDLMLPELDGISLLQSAASAGLCPMVLVTSRFYNDYILGALGELSVGYMMRKPCDIPATAARIGDLSRHIRAPLVTPARPSDAGDQSAAFPEHSFQTPGLRIPPGSHSEDDERPRPAHYKGAVSGGGRGLRLQGHPRGALHPKRHRYRMEAAGRPCLAAVFPRRLRRRHSPPVQRRLHFPSGRRSAAESGRRKQ